MTHLTRKHLAVAAALFAVSGCQSIPLPQINRPPVAPSSTADEELETIVGALPPQRLSSGECGMFLWSRDAERRLVMFSKSRDDTAIMMLNDREQLIPRMSGEGRDVLGYAARQTYTWRGLTVVVAIEIEQRAGLGRGAIIPTGTIEMSRRDGWSYVVPVGGIVACES